MNYNYYVERDDRQYEPEYFETLEEAIAYCNKQNLRWINHREYVYDIKSNKRIY